MPSLEQAYVQLDAYVHRLLSAARIPGMALAITDRERTLRVATYGYANLEAQTPIAPGMLFQPGSIGKSFTAIALLQEHEAGRLDLHTPVTRYVPWFEVRSGYGPITIHHLLTHTAGLSSGIDFSPDSRSQVWALRESETGWEPGSRWAYSNDGYKTLGLVLRAITGKSYAEIIRERILAPLGMDASEPVITNDCRARMAVGYTEFYDDRPNPPDAPLAPAGWFETDTADGCLAATAPDMAAYVRMLLNRGAGPSSRILSAESFALLTQCVIEQLPDVWYGYGLTIREEDSRTIVGHGGGMPGFISSITADLDSGIGAVVFLNGHGDASAPAAYARQLVSAVRRGDGLPDPPAVPDPLSIEDASSYAGHYTGERGHFTIRADGDRLYLEWKGATLQLERRRQDAFFVPHPDFALHLLQFGREDEAVVEATHGPRWYQNERHTGPTEFDTPAEWAPYRGHYRCFSPWISNVRVYPRKDRLLFELSQYSAEIPLAPQPDGSFALEAGMAPALVRFGPIVDGQAITLNLSGGTLYRVDMP
jgi:CubicO group peptidase (beta-lactamase class C family)